jgi:hypothetical protein
MARDPSIIDARNRAPLEIFAECDDGADAGTAFPNFDYSG